MRTRQSTVPRVQNEGTVRTSTEAVPPFLDDEEGQKFVEQVYSEVESEEEIDVTKTVPSLSKRGSQTIEIGELFLYLSENGPSDSDLVAMALKNYLLNEQHLSRAHIIMCRDIMIRALQIM